MTDGRPYFQKSTDELEELAKRDWNSAPDLRTIEEELAFRNRPRARELRTPVGDRLRQLGSQDVDRVKKEGPARPVSAAATTSAASIRTGPVEHAVPHPAAMSSATAVAPYALPAKLVVVSRRLAEKVGAGRGAVSGSTAANVHLAAQWDALLGTADTEEKLRSVAEGLSASQLRILGAGLGSLRDAELRRRGAQVCFWRQPRSFRRRAVGLLVRFFRESISRVAAQACLDAGIEPRMQALAKARLAQNPIAELLRLLPPGAGWASWCGTYGARTDVKDTGLGSAAALAVLALGSAAQMRAQPPADRVAAFRVLNDADWPAAMNGCLSKLEQKEWTEAELDAVVKELGPPRSSRDPRWAKVEERIRRTIQTLLDAREMRRFFGYGERYEFWLNYLHVIKDVTPRLDGMAFGLDFERFGVIEFREVGNAAYVYPPEAYRLMLTRHASKPADLKDKRLGKDLWHRGDWQQTFRAVLNRLSR